MVIEVIKSIKLLNSRYIFTQCELQSIIGEDQQVAPRDWLQSWQELEKIIELHPRWERASGSLDFYFESMPLHELFSKSKYYFGRNIIGPPAGLAPPWELGDFSPRQAWELELAPELVITSWETVYMHVSQCFLELEHLGHQPAQDWRLKLEMKESSTPCLEMGFKLQLFSYIKDFRALKNPFEMG